MTYRLEWPLSQHLSVPAVVSLRPFTKSSEVGLAVTLSPSAMYRRSTAPCANAGTDAGSGLRHRAARAHPASTANHCRSPWSQILFHLLAFQSTRWHWSTALERADHRYGPFGPPFVGAVRLVGGCDKPPAPAPLSSTGERARSLWRRGCSGIQTVAVVTLALLSGPERMFVRTDGRARDGDEARVLIEWWDLHYDIARRHSSLR